MSFHISDDPFLAKQGLHNFWLVFVKEDGNCVIHAVYARGRFIIASYPGQISS